MANWSSIRKAFSIVQNIKRYFVTECRGTAHGQPFLYTFSASTIKERRRNACTRRLLALYPATVSSGNMCSSTEELQLECQKLRNMFLEKERHWNNNVSLSILTDNEKLIHELHKVACQEYKFTYIDPDSGYQVFTRYRHFLRGKCCGTGCRHCPFEHEAVSDERKFRTRFNSSFYVPDANIEDTKLDSD